MIYLLDTNIVSAFRKKHQHPNLVKWVSEAGWRDLTTSTVTVAEIQCRAERVRKSDPRLADGIDAWLDRMLADGQPQIVTMSANASRLLGKMYEAPRLRHFIITDPAAKNAGTGADLAIAAIAIAEGGAVVTKNVRHFMQIHQAFPLPGLFDPIADAWHVQPPSL